MLLALPAPFKTGSPGAYRHGNPGLLRILTDCGSESRREFGSAKLVASTPAVHWYAKARNAWKSLSVLAPVVHHQTFIRYLRDDERYALIIPDDDQDWLG